MRAPDRFRERPNRRRFLPQATFKVIEAPPLVLFRMLNYRRVHFLKKKAAPCPNKPAQIMSNWLPTSSQPTSQTTRSHVRAPVLDCGCPRLVAVRGRGPEGAAERATCPGGFDQEVRSAGLHRVLGGRKEVSIPQTAPAEVRHDPRPVPRKMGLAARLPDGGSELRQPSLRAGPGHWFGASAQGQAEQEKGCRLTPPRHV